VSDNGGGVILDSANHNTLSNNAVIDNGYDGILLIFSAYNRVEENQVTTPLGHGIRLHGSTDNVISFNNASYNGLTGIALHDSSNYNLIEGNNVADNVDGITLDSSDGNTITANEAVENNDGIRLYYSTDNLVNCNNVIKNTQGIVLQNSSNNTITANSIVNNWGGIWLYYSSNNKFYHNNFIDNTQQVLISDSFNTAWDNGYPSGGNYWSDYVGVDVKSGPSQDLHGSDGIGDTPYIIDASNTDHYPLMNPYGAPPPPTYSLTITPTVGGITEPAPRTYSYTANSTVQVTATPNTGYLFDHWELDSVNVGSANPYSVLMNKNHVLKAVFSPIPPPLSASISPLSASILAGQSVTFTSTVSGGYTPYSYQWYLNGNPVSGATSNTWTFTPTAGGIYYIYLKVTDAKGNTTQSETARITVATVPVGGYSIPIQSHTVAKPSSIYLAIMAILTAAFTTVRRKTHKRRK
jgi:parallel beta-helix repeat protein